MRGLSFTAGGEYYAVDVTLVQKVARNLAVTPVPAAMAAVVGIANLKGRVITILSLSAMLGRGREKYETHETRETYRNEIHAVIFKSDTGSDQMGLLIDKPGDLLEIDADKILAPSLLSGTSEAKNHFCISGAAEIGTGTEKRIYRIVNIDLIMNKFKGGGEAGESI
jgi:purine-binding chemotaxis protein CheW